MIVNNNYASGSSIISSLSVTSNLVLEKFYIGELITTGYLQQKTITYKEAQEFEKKGGSTPRAPTSGVIKYLQVLEHSVWLLARYCC